VTESLTELLTDGPTHYVVTPAGREWNDQADRFGGISLGQGEAGKCGEQQREEGFHV
jgi:hypothetical protein